MNTQLTLDDLKSAIEELGDRFPKLSDDDLLWRGSCVHTSLIVREREATEALGHRRHGQSPYVSVRPERRDPLTVVLPGP